VPFIPQPSSLFPYLSNFSTREFPYPSARPKFRFADYYRPILQGTPLKKP